MSKLPKKQKGALTMISAVLILILLTELVIYAVQVGVFEQRKSANDMRQKEAFHIAESAIQFGKEYLLANAREAASPGWIADRWKPCGDLNLTGTGTHPCYGEPADNDTDFPIDLRNNMYYYDPDDASLKGANDPDGHPTLPVDISTVITGATERANVYALLCMLHIEKDPSARTVMPNSPVQGCTTDESVGGLQDPNFFMITLMAKGEADCDGGTCRARALITEKVGSYGPAVGDGGPSVPLTARSTLPPGGTAEIVPNPNAGGIGVPVSAWVNQRECGAPFPSPPDNPFDPNGGSWSTCEAQEWYGTDTQPEDLKCPSAQCSCGPAEKRLSYSDNTGQQWGIDLLADDTAFPCDLWQYMLGQPKYDTEGNFNQDSIDFVRNFLVDEVVDAADCDQLGPDSVGYIWVEGGTCKIAANTQIGSPADDPTTTDKVEGPVFLISAAETISLAGGASVFGTLFITDILVGSASLESVGNFTVYGAAVIDAELDKYSGTFQVVYVEDVIKSSVEAGRFGAVAGGWTDFHPDWR